MAEARQTLTDIWAVLYPYRKPPESATVRGVLWRAWEDERVRDWIPTFDYQLGTDSTGDPCVRIWLILEDSVDIGAPETRAGLTRLRLLFRKRLQEADIDWWPYAGVYIRSEVASVVARASA